MQYIQDFHQAELAAAETMKSWGFSDAKATTGGADGGIDVRSSKALAQVKWKGGAAGRPEIQNLVGARGVAQHKQLFFFAASTYTKAALDYAELMDVRLFIYDPLGKAEPANDRARRFVKTLGTTSTISNPKTPWLLYVGYLVAALLGIVAMMIAAQT